MIKRITKSTDNEPPSEKDAVDGVVEALTAQTAEEKMAEIVARYSFDEAEMEFETRPVSEIMEEADKIDPKKAADEVIQWLITNVAHYIENKQRFFRIDLVIEENSSEDMENIKLLQDLYRAIPEDSEFVDMAAITDNYNEIDDSNFDEVVNCRIKLNDLSDQIHAEMKESALLNDLFQAMIFFYEMIGINQGSPLLKELKGSVDVAEFMYEAFSVGVKVFENNAEDAVTSYTVPEGFSMALEISFIDKARSSTLF